MVTTATLVRWPTKLGFLTMTMPGPVGNGSTSQNIDSEEGQIQYQNGNDQKKGGFPGVPKSGTQTGIVLMLLPVILFGFVVRSEWVKSRENLLA